MEQHTLSAVPSEQTPARPIHDAEAVARAMRAMAEPAPRTLEGWRFVLREAAPMGPCRWCGGDGRGVAVRGRETPLLTTSGCPLCRGSGVDGDAAKRLLAEYPGGLLALAAAVAAELDRVQGIAAPGGAVATVGPQ